jgi:hypothetical protein
MGAALSDTRTGEPGGRAAAPVAQGWSLRGGVWPILSL